MTDEIIEYYPNGGIKYKIAFDNNGKKKFKFYPNGSKSSEQYYDQNGKFHREDWLPDYHSWYSNGITYEITYFTHGVEYNINNPSWLRFMEEGKIDDKGYDINDGHHQNKLYWQNFIKKL